LGRVREARTTEVLGAALDQIFNVTELLTGEWGRLFAKLMWYISEYTQVIFMEYVRLIDVAVEHISKLIDKATQAGIGTDYAPPHMQNQVQRSDSRGRLQRIGSGLSSGLSNVMDRATRGHSHRGYSHPDSQQNKLQSAFQSDVKELEVRKQQLLRKKENLKQHLFAIKGEAKANLAGQQPLPVPSDQ